MSATVPTPSSDREVLDDFSEAIRRMSQVLADGEPAVRVLDGGLALAAVGAINELVLRAAEDGPDAVRALGATATELVVSLMAAPRRD